MKRLFGCDSRPLRNTSSGTKRKSSQGESREVAVREQEVGDDGLCPCGPGLIRGCDDNVVVARREVVPPSAVEVMALIDTVTLG